MRLRGECFEEYSKSARRVGRFIVLIFRHGIGEKSRDRRDYTTEQSGWGQCLS